MAKPDLKAGLSGNTQKPKLNMGRGVELSTHDPHAIDEDAKPQERIDAKPQERIIAQDTRQKVTGRDGIQRINRGYTLREDLIKHYKRIALDEERPLYLVMEEALEEYLKRRK